ncbi:MAG: NAD-dependent malic enzyme [Bacteroidetes bacterium]|nr:NAD-dependent malic enzyme [Bacteroidota bacterium]
MGLKEDALRLHREARGKIEVHSKVPLNGPADLSLAYTPGVAEACREIARDPELLDTYTSRWNLVAVVSDGSAVLGLGNIGAKAAMPVMEGKSILFKILGGVDAFPICLGTQDQEEIVRTVELLQPTFGGINLEDIAAPKCWYVENELKKRCNIPIFHDDQHGTAVVVSAAIINAAKVTGRKMADLLVVINGAGAAGVAVAKLLLSMGVGDLILCDSRGIIHKDRPDLNPGKREMAEISNRANKKGTLADALKGFNTFIGVSAPNVVTTDMVKTMGKDAILFAMANPDPEILPDAAKAGGAKVVGTGRSDFPNQVNNVSGFPGIFRGALDARATDINEPMKIAAANALANLVGDELSVNKVLPAPLDPRIVPALAAAVAVAAVDSGVARVKITAEEAAASARKLTGRG